MSGARRLRIEREQVVQDRRAGARLTDDDDGTLDPDFGDLWMLATPADDAEPDGEIVHEVTGRDLDADTVQPRLGREAFDEQVEAFLPRVFAEVVGAGARDGLGDEAVSD